MDTQGDPGGISSYIQRARFNNITEWKNPALFSHVLMNFNSLTTLLIFNTEIPDEVFERISHGELAGNRVTALYFLSMRSSLVIPMILAFQNLQILFIYNLTVTPREPPLPLPAPLQGRQLDSLRVVQCTNGVAEALANARFESRHLTLDVQTENIQKLLVLSSATVVELMLLGVYLLYVYHRSINGDFADFPESSTSHPINLPQFPALTSLKIFISGHAPSPHLINTLSPISSAPLLASIALECWWQLPSEPSPPNTWGHLDGWLSRTAKNATVEGGLVLTLTRWLGGQVPDVFFPQFREVGKISTDSKGLRVFS